MTTLRQPVEHLRGRGRRDAQVRGDGSRRRDLAPVLGGEHEPQRAHVGLAELHVPARRLALPLLGLTPAPQPRQDAHDLVDVGVVEARPAHDLLTGVQHARVQHRQIRGLRRLRFTLHDRSTSRG
jgi:hypothetical protein